MVVVPEFPGPDDLLATDREAQVFRRFFFAVVVLSAGFACAQTALPAAQSGAPYRVQLGAAVSGVYPFTFTYESLPDWVQHSPAGQVWGTPAATDETAQPVVFAVNITDAQGHNMGRFMFSISVSKEAPVPLVIAASPGTPGATPPPAPAAAPAATPAPAPAPAPTPAPAPSGPTTQPAAPADTSSGDSSSQASASANKKANSKLMDPPTLHEPVEQGAGAVLGTAAPFATVVLVRGSKTPEVMQTIADQYGEFKFKLKDDHKLKAVEELQVHQIVNGALSGVHHRTVTPYYRNGEELRAIMGYQQAGASAAKSEQNFFLDFFISRPLAFMHHDTDTQPTRVRWWGNVRIASYPQQGDIPVSTFASTFVQQFGQLKVNQLAQSAEYLTGLDIRLLSSRLPFIGRSENTRQHFDLSLFGGAGATGPMDPQSTLHVFEVPAAGSAQRPAFDRNFPGVTTPLIGFVSPDRDSFYRQYLLGLRLTTSYMDKYSRSPLISAPAMFSLAVGQNELVTGGKLQGGVLRTEAFYPLPFFNRAQDRRGALAAIYLFGSSQIRLKRAHNLEPMILNPSTVSGSDPSVTIVTVPSNRDIYRIGFGIDLVHTIMALTHPNDTTKINGTTTPPAVNPAPAPKPPGQ